MRGQGLLNAIVVRPGAGAAAWDILLRLRDNGLLVRTGCLGDARLLLPL